MEIIENINLKDIITISLILFAVIDILGSIPVILDLKAKTGPIDAKLTTLVSGFIMFMFLFIGNQILKLIGLDVASFSVAGAIVIFLLGLEMVLNRDIFKSHGDPKTSSIIPIAFPIIAGAGTLTTLLALRAEYHLTNIIISILINLLFVYVVILFLPKIEKTIGDGGIEVLRRVFGIILLAIAVKLFTKNLYLLFGV
ncbi:MAG: MarC family protein [Chitinophagales bacterium]|nr:MarC family protein [Chitinophagales bacterium]MCZ2392702.1 MarC family protein [Chitinophagales bacterium]